MASPFARAQMMMAAIAAAMAMSGSAKAAAMANIGPYQSRGKGRGKTSPSRHTVAMDRRGIRKAKSPKLSHSKPIARVGTKELERAKRCYMHNGILHQMSKRQYEAQLAQKVA